MQIATLRKIFMMMCFLILGYWLAFSGTKTYVGLYPNFARDWERPANWQPAGAPTLSDTAYLALDYVAITGTDCQAHTVIIQNGGYLAIRKSDNGKKLTVAHGIIIDGGGTFGAKGLPGTNGPVVYIAGDVVCNGTWDLAGVCTGNAGVAFNGAGTQTISGSGNLTFQNLTNQPNDRLIVSATNVGVLGTVNPSVNYDVQTTSGGTFVVGSGPLPITLASFGATQVANSSSVCLRWVTLSEINNYGFSVERRAANVQAYQTIGFVATQGNGIQPHQYTYTDATVSSGSWAYRLRQIDLTGESVVFDPVFVDIQSLASVEGTTAPALFRLRQNYPNPFNPSTEIRFTVAGRGNASLCVYNSVGQLVGTLFEGDVAPGKEYTASFVASGVASGTYFCRLEAGERTDVIRMLFIK
jgi:hypothetical protein